MILIASTKPYLERPGAFPQADRLENVFWVGDVRLYLSTLGH